MILSADKLRAIVNLLSDPLQAHAAAHRLTEEASERGVLVADLIASALAPAPPLSPPAPRFADVESEDDPATAIGKRINEDAYGLRSLVLDETVKAWRVRTPKVFGLPEHETWLPKSRCEQHGEDAQGRAIFIVPAWLIRRKRAGQ